MRTIRVTLQQNHERKENINDIYNIAEKHNLELSDSCRKTELTVEDVNTKELLYTNEGKWSLDFTGNDSDVKGFIDDLRVYAED